MRETRMRSQCFSMPPLMVEAIKDIATAESIPMSYVVRMAVRAYLIAHGYPYPAPRDGGEEEDVTLWWS